MNEHPREAYDHSWARCSGSAAGSFIIATTEFRFRHTPLPWVLICNAETRQADLHHVFYSPIRSFLLY